MTFPVVPDGDFATEAIVFPPLVDRRASSFSAAWSGTAGGDYRPPGWHADMNFPSYPFIRFEARDVYYAPKLGLIATEDGSVSHVSYVEAKYRDAELNGIAALWEARTAAPYVPHASVVIPWGGISNYGHFVLDALTSLPFLAPPFLTPPLTDWQREHFRLLGIDPHELDVPLCRIGLLAYTSAMAHSLHRPNLHHVALKSRYPRDAHAQASTAQGVNLYVSRRAQRRPYLSEAKLIDRLASLDFRVVQPERYSVADQIRLFQEARLIVAPTGAALANCFYCRPGVRVVELIPRDMIPNERAYRWTGYQVALAEGDWRPYFCENSLDLDEAPVWGGRPRSGYLPFDADVDEVLAFVHQALQP